MRSLPPLFSKPLSARRTSVVLTVAVIGILLLCQHFRGLWTPVPGMVLLLVLALGTFAGGLRAGLDNAVLTILYFLFYYLGPGAAKQGRFSEENITDLILLCLTALSIATLIGVLRRKLTEALRREMSLQSAQEARRSLEKIIENSPDGVVGLTTDGIITSWNAAAARISGYSANEIIGKHISVMAGPEYREQQAEQFARACRGEFFGAYEASRIGKDGRKMELSVHFVPSLAADGTVQAVTCMARDITDRKRAEEALRESDSRFRLLVENASDTLLMHDIQGHFVNVNEAACQALGYSREELLTMSVTDIDVDWRGVPPFWGDLPAGEVRVVSGFHRRKDGSTFPVEAHVSVVSGSGSSRLLIASARDTTAQKRAEELLESRAHQQQAVSSLGLKALRQDADDQEALDQLFKGAITLVAETLRTELSTVLEHLPGSGHFLYRACHGWPEGTLGREMDFVTGAGSLVGYTLMTCEPVIITDYRTETRFHVPPHLLSQGVVSGMSVVIYGENDSPYGTLSVHIRHQRDFSEDDVAFLQAAANILSAAITRQQSRATLQSALREAAAARLEAERANHAKSEFLSRMSHELRTPLNAILGFGQLLQMDEGINELNKDCANHVVTAGRHLLSLIDDVLDIARIESGNDTLHLEPVSVPDMLQKTMQLVRPTAAEHGIGLELVSGQPTYCAVIADDRRLKQILLNLLSNAIKYNNSGGKVIVDWAQGENGVLRLRVRDTGPGLTAEQIGRLCSPFERLDAEQRGIQGTGLGLAVSRRLVEAMGGVFGVDSTPGQGSVFWVDLPMAEAEVNGLLPVENGLDHPTASARDGAQMTILQIEDNPSNQRVVKILLASQRPRWRLLSAPNARTGMDLARRQKPAVILLDLHLPDLHGEEVLAMLREDRDTKHIPVVILSADATQYSRERLLAAGAVAYINKPFEVSELLKLLDTLVARNFALPEPVIESEKRFPKRTRRIRHSSNSGAGVKNG